MTTKTPRLARDLRDQATNGPNRYIDAEVKAAFDARSAENESVLADSNGREMLASEARVFDRNLHELTELKALMEDMAPPARGAAAYASDEQAAQVYDESDPSGFVVGATKGFRFARADLQSLWTAASQRTVKAVISTTTGPPGYVPEVDLTSFPALRDKARLLDYIPARPTAAGRTTYFRATTPANQAAAVAAGANKPESSPVWEEVVSKVEKIAHWGRAHDEVVADWDGFLSTVSEEFIAGLIDKETDELLNGTGVSPSLRGLLNTVGIQTQAFATNIVVTAATAANKLRTGSAKTEPDLFVFNPADWLAICLFRTGGSTATDGPFLVDPLTSPKLELWGTPVVVTTRIAAGAAVVANMKAAARAKIRQAPTVEVAPGVGEAEWKANITLIRAEERLVLEVPRPGAVVSFATV